MPHFCQLPRCITSVLLISFIIQHCLYWSKVKMSGQIDIVDIINFTDCTFKKVVYFNAGSFELESEKRKLRLRKNVQNNYSVGSTNRFQYFYLYFFLPPLHHSHSAPCPWVNQQLLSPCITSNFCYCRCSLRGAQDLIRNANQERHLLLVYFSPAAPSSREARTEQIELTSSHTENNL